MCHPWADCVNTNGGYKCVCRAGTQGGGAAANATVITTEGHRPPVNVGDGQPGCRDVQVCVCGLSVGLGWPCVDLCRGPLHPS